MKKVKGYIPISYTSIMFEIKKIGNFYRKIDNEFYYKCLHMHFY